MAVQEILYDHQDYRPLPPPPSMKQPEQIQRPNFSLQYVEKDVEKDIDHIFSKETRRISKHFLVIFFSICFLASIGYWFYEVYYVYETDISLKTTEQIGKAGIHSFVAFQASLLSFALIYAWDKII